MPDRVADLAELHAATGALNAVYEFPDRLSAGIALNSIEADQQPRSGLSCWRCCDPDYTRWKVIVLTEEDNRAHFDRACRIAGRRGTRLATYDEATTAMVDALRLRRWNHRIQASLGGPRGSRARFGQGAYLHRDGRMTPKETGQG